LRGGGRRAAAEEFLAELKPELWSKLIGKISNKTSEGASEDNLKNHHATTRVLF